MCHIHGSSMGRVISATAVAMKLHKHGMKVAERELERTVDKVQLWLMTERGTNDAMVIMRRVQKEHYAEGKMCFVDLEKALYREIRKVLEWAMRKKGIPEVMVTSVMRPYERVKIIFRMDSQL